MAAQDGWKSRKQLNDMFLDAYWQQNDCQGWRFIIKTRWTLWYCFFYVKQSIDNDRYISINAKKVYSKMIIDGTTNRSWWRFSRKKRNGWWDPGWLSMQKTTSHDECFLRSQKRNMNLDDYRWNKRLINIDECSLKHLNFKSLLDYR